jgi:hypothetical protein
MTPLCMLKQVEKVKFKLDFIQSNISELQECRRSTKPHKHKDEGNQKWKRPNLILKAHIKPFKPYSTGKSNTEKERYSPFLVDSLIDKYERA